MTRMERRVVPPLLLVTISCCSGAILTAHSCCIERSHLHQHRPQTYRYLRAVHGKPLQLLPTVQPRLLNTERCRLRRVSDVHMLAQKKKGGNGAPTKISAKGFGSAVVRAKAKPGEVGTLLTDPAYEALRSWLSAEGASLDKVGIADFDGLRGVIAMQNIQAGEEIISIPANCALDLGTQGDDPIPPALQLLSAIATDDGRRQAYFEVLPSPDSPDLCTPDFFSEKELQMLQWPPIVREVRARSAALRKVLGSAAPTGDTRREEMAVAGGRLRELKWAAWIVLSRVLTVLGPDGAGHKLLIPFIDMFNHRASSRHYLTGRTDRSLRVVAGTRVAAGEQIYIVYGTEATSNAELLAHYGFIDPTAAAADERLVAMNPDAVPALQATSAEADKEMLSSEPTLPRNEQLALQLRLALKRAVANSQQGSTA
mmetsp:Transcript_29906/g.63019  ORF Transcript_29906/g.63019 Transcript_29906/m.63019 type:complete len:427 (-) Transcript_29906:295-1575(-)